MKKKILGILGSVLVVLLAFSLSACGGKESKGSDDEANRTKLVVGFDQDFPPYGYLGDDGEFTGFDLDLAKEVCERNGWEVEYKPINWDAKDLELSSGSIDCIWNGFTIEGREGDYTFTDPYMDNSQVIVVSADSGISSLEDLEGKVVMAQVDSAAFYLLQEDGDQAELAATFKDVMTVPDYNSAFMELKGGAVDAVAMDLPVARFQIVGQESDFVILESTPLSSEHYGVGFLKGNDALRDKVQKTLEEMAEDGTVDKIIEKYEEQGILPDMWCL